MSQQKQEKLIRKIISFDVSTQFSCCHEKRYQHMRSEHAERRDTIIEEIVKLDINAEKYLQNYKARWEQLWKKFLDVDTRSSFDSTSTPSSANQNKNE